DKVRIAKLKARLPPRIDGFMKALRAGKDDGILQFLNLEKGATEQARNVHLGLLKLAVGLAAWGAELQAWQIENMEFNEEVTRCNAAVTLKFRTKAGQERTADRTPQTWQYIDDDWFLQVAQRNPRKP
ncbi:MAG: hypothetical protein NTW87_34990, partial [Planctomycetota bacterium]|nr:hypothetical protein [Planctomycetota bacterium]